MIKKTLGYLISAIGIFGLLIGTIKNFREGLNLVPKSIGDTTITIISLIIIAIGIAMLYKPSFSRKKVHEVPIYHGKDVVGYRRIHK